MKIFLVKNSDENKINEEVYFYNYLY